jgi:hypothetical protein
LAETLSRLQGQGFAFPFDIGRGTPLSAEQRDVLFRLFVTEVSRRYWVGSAELAEHWHQQERVAGVPAGTSPMEGPPWAGPAAGSA